MGTPQVYRWSLLVLATMLLWSCDAGDDSRPIDPTHTVVSLVQNQPALSSFYEALERANLLPTLRSQNLNFTLFAPDNTAFAAYLQQAGYSSLEQVPPALLEPLLRYHISLGNKAVSSLDSTVLNTLADKRIITYRTPEALLLNKNIELSQGDLRATNGIVHILSDVLNPPVQSLAGLLESSAAAGEYELLQAALERTGLLGLLEEKGRRFTLFAPTDAAFIAAGYSSEEDFDSLEPEQLRSILQHHLLTEYRFSHMLKSGSYRSLQGDSIRFDAATNTLQGKGNAQHAQLVPAQLDQFTTNGILHGIDAILIP
jgi:transforming growth factor-beta-induced protein